MYKTIPNRRYHYSVDSIVINQNSELKLYSNYKRQVWWPLDGYQRWLGKLLSLITTLVLTLIYVREQSRLGGSIVTVWGH
jgi:hypothetical protein